MPIIDSQIHPYEANTPKRPWLATLVCLLLLVAACTTMQPAKIIDHRRRWCVIGHGRIPLAVMACRSSRLARNRRDLIVPTGTFNASATSLSDSS